MLSPKQSRLLAAIVPSSTYLIVLSLISQEEDRKILFMSTKEDEDSVMAVKLEACEVLLQHRVEQKFKSKKVC